MASGTHCLLIPASPIIIPSTLAPLSLSLSVLYQAQKKEPKKINEKKIILVESPFLLRLRESVTLDGRHKNNNEHGRQRNIPYTALLRFGPYAPYGGTKLQWERDSVHHMPWN